MVYLERVQSSLTDSVSFSPELMLLFFINDQGIPHPIGEGLILC